MTEEFPPKYERIEKSNEPRGGRGEYVARHVPGKEELRGGSVGAARVRDELEDARRYAEASGEEPEGLPITPKDKQKVEELEAEIAEIEQTIKEYNEDSPFARAWHVLFDKKGLQERRERVLRELRILRNKERR